MCFDFPHQKFQFKTQLQQNTDSKAKAVSHSNWKLNIKLGDNPRPVKSVVKTKSQNNDVAGNCHDMK